jgi:hypothetical protein
MTPSTSNAVHYTDPAHATVIDKRFAVHTKASANDLPPDSASDTRTRVKALVAAFATTGNRLTPSHLNRTNLKIYQVYWTIPAGYGQRSSE